MCGGSWLPRSALRSTHTTAVAQGQLRVPRFAADPLWNKPLPHKWTTGQVSGVAVDSHDHVWIVHRPASIADGEKAASFNPPLAECCIPAPPILEFDPNGNMVNAFGGPGAGYEWPSTEHGIFVDDKDNVWTAGSGQGRRPDPEVHEQGEVPAPDRPQRPEQGQQRHPEPGAAGRHLRAREDQRAVCR